MITFNRNGEIEKMALLQSSGSKILDDEVMRTLKSLGPLGRLPKAYNKEKFILIAFFQYGMERGMIRSTLH
jgi:protein TonB